MRVWLVMMLGLVGGGIALPAGAAGLTHIEAINRCEAFVESALVPQIGDSLKTPYKVTCYFALIDPQIDTQTETVCSRTAATLGGANRQIAEFICHGAYETHRREQAESR